MEGALVEDGKQSDMGTSITGGDDDTESELTFDTWEDISCFAHSWWAQQAATKMPHKSVPKPRDFSRREGTTTKREVPVTTVMLRNVPNRCSRELLVQELERLGFAEQFDFVYLPIDRSTQQNVGYAFVNFVDPEAAARATSRFTNHRFRQFQRSKCMLVSPAHIQGLRENLKHYSNTAVMGERDDGHRPLVLPKAGTEFFCAAAA